MLWTQIFIQIFCTNACVLSISDLLNWNNSQYEPHCHNTKYLSYQTIKFQPIKNAQNTNILHRTLPFFLKTQKFVLWTFPIGWIEISANQKCSEHNFSRNSYWLNWNFSHSELLWTQIFCIITYKLLCSKENWLASLKFQPIRIALNTNIQNTRACDAEYLCSEQL